MKTLTQPRPVRDELIALTCAVRAERDRGKARPGDTASDCEHSRFSCWSGRSWCDAVSLEPHVYFDFPCTASCKSFRRRTRG